MRRKSDEENLAEWLVEITVTPDADAGSSFAATYDRFNLALMPPTESWSAGQKADFAVCCHHGQRRWSCMNV